MSTQHLTTAPQTSPFQVLEGETVLMCLHLRRPRAARALQSDMIVCSLDYCAVTKGAG